MKIEPADSSQIQGIEVKIQAIRVAQGKGYGDTHVGHPHLGQNGAVQIFHHAVNDALRVDENFDPFGGDIKDPPCLYNLKTFVHHGGRINSDLGSHLPSRVVQGHLGGDSGQGFLALSEKRSAGSGEDHLAHGSAILPHEGLEHGRVLAVHGDDTGTGALRFFGDELSGCDEGLLVGEGDDLPCLHSGISGHNPGSPDNGRDNNVGLVCGGCFQDPVNSIEHLDTRTFEQIPGPGSGFLFIYGDKCRFEKLGLVRDGLPVRSGGKRDDFKNPGLPRDDVQRIAADGPGGTQDAYPSGHGHHTEPPEMDRM